MNSLYKFLLCLCFAILSVSANDTQLDNLLEKAHHAASEDEKKIVIEKLKLELAQINKKAREEADAIIDAKKKIPTKLFNDKR